MASDKTEQPTAKRLRDARKKGQVAKSQEIGSAAGIIMSCSMVWLLWGSISDRLRACMREAMRSASMPFDQAVWDMGQLCFETLIFVCTPVILGVVVGSLASQLAQIGLLLSGEAAKPSLGKLSPKQWVKKVFSKKGLLEIAKTLGKVILLGSVLWSVVLDHVDGLLKAGLRDLANFMVVFGDTLWVVLVWTAAVFALVAAVDYYFQRRFHIAELMMSKDEVRREYKEMEGDPQIKSQRKQLHKELAMNNAVNAAAEATVLVTNPTHIAVALKYVDGETPLPLITATGQGSVALKMMEVAEKNNVPIMRNVPLARSLHSEGRINDYIPRELMGPVAEIIRWVKTVTAQR